MQIKDPCKVCIVQAACQRYISKCDQAQNHFYTWKKLSKIFARVLVVSVFAIPITQIYLSKYFPLLPTVWSVFVLLVVMLWTDYNFDQTKNKYKHVLLDHANQRPIKPPPPPCPPPKRKIH